jgi:endonuclease I
MLVHRRLTAFVAAVCATVGLGLVAPTTPATAAPAAAAHDPATYYAGTEGLSGAALAAKLNTIIKGHTRLSYAQLWDALPVTDADPGRSGYLTDFYSGASILATNRCSSSCGPTTWNREHTWAKSHGDFGEAAGPGTDLHHMRPEFANTNSRRGNLDFDDGGSAGVPNCADCRVDGDSFEPRDAVKGDLARGLMYMAVRYEGDDGMVDLKLNDQTCNKSGPGNLGKLSTLVAWSLADPPDDRERARNDVIDSTYQHNRNPFIDHPEWVTSIFGSGVGKGPACGSTSGTEYEPGGTTANQPPTTAPMTATTDEDTTATVPLRATDPDGDALTWTITQPPAHGRASVAGSTMTYVPDADFHGTDRVGVSVSDGQSSVATTVTITVTPVNDAPVARDVAASTTRDASVPVQLSGSDVDGDALTYAVASAPAHGTVTISGATATYTPAAGYAGADRFTYTASDGRLTSAPATASITVTATNRAPVATSGTAETVEGGAVRVTLTGSDPDGDPLTYAVATSPAHGTVTISGATATYTPAAGFGGTDSFTFTASDGRLTSAPATVTLTVTRANRAPVVTSAPAVQVTAGARATVAIEATDADGDPLTYTVTGPAAHGSATIAANQATYVPAVRSGSDTFQVTVSDGRGGTASAQVAVTITARTAQLTLSTPTVTRGENGTITIAATGPAGPRPTGSVALLASGRTVATATLVDGVATVPAPSAQAGTSELTAAYAGDGLFGPATSTPTTLTVTRSTSRLRLGLTKRGRAAVVKVRIATVAGEAATGQVRLTVGKRKLTARLHHGVATFRVTALPRAAKVKASARYAGDRQYLAASRARAFRLGR